MIKYFLMIIMSSTFVGSFEIAINKYNEDSLELEKIAHVDKSLIEDIFNLQLIKIIDLNSHEFTHPKLLSVRIYEYDKAEEFYIGFNDDGYVHLYQVLDSKETILEYSSKIKIDQFKKLINSLSFMGVLKDLDDI